MENVFAVNQISGKQSILASEFEYEKKNTPSSVSNSSYLPSL